MTDQNRTTDRPADQRSSYERARSSASSAYSSSKRTTKDAAQKTAAGIETNPLAMLAGGVAVGAIAGALLPRSVREKELLAPLGRKLSETARQAFAAAKDAGQQELDGAGLTKGAARDQGKQLLDGVAKALSSAGAAAAGAAKQPASARQTTQASPASKSASPPPAYASMSNTPQPGPAFTSDDSEPPLAGV